MLAVSAYSQENKSEILSNFLNDILTIEAANLTSSEPIAGLAALAAEQSVKSMELTKENVEDALKQAAGYAHSIIIVGAHTVVRITDLNDCRRSGAWAACMPMGRGYVQKAGILHQKQDYINNIIGIPDQQTRTIYFFKE